MGLEEEDYKKILKKHRSNPAYQPDPMSKKPDDGNYLLKLKQKAPYLSEYDTVLSMGDAWQKAAWIKYQSKFRSKLGAEEKTKFLERFFRVQMNFLNSIRGLLPLEDLEGAPVLNVLSKLLGDGLTDKSIRGGFDVVKAYYKFDAQGIAHFKAPDPT